MTMTLEQAYTSITSYIPKNSVESLQVLKQIQEYWTFWKPTTTNVLLLAESHVYTSDYDFEVNCSKIKLEEFIKNYPLKFARLVYCLGYGEPSLLNQKLSDNSGTPQFWKIFCSCIAKDENDLGFSRILKGTTSYFGRIRNKINILQELKRRGIWLIDASIVGIYRGVIDDPEIKSRVFHDSWDYYLKDLVTEIHPKHITVIGKAVASALSWRLGSLCSSIDAECTVLPQPQGNRGSSEEQLETYREYQRVCSKYAPTQYASAYAHPPESLSPKINLNTIKVKQPPNNKEQRIGWSQLIKESNIEVQTISEVLTERIVRLENVTSRSSGKNYVFNKGETGSLSRFAAFMPRKQALAIRIRTDSAIYPDKQGLIGEKTYNWFFHHGRGIEREFKITKMEQIDFAFELIKQSYTLADLK